MKIWCLRCGEIIDETKQCNPRVTLCPCCSERIAYSVKDGEAHIACLNYDLSVNNEINIVPICSAAG